MVKMVSLKKSAADQRAEKEAMGEHGIAAVPAEDEGVTVHLDHHHLMKMKGQDGEPIAGQLKSGHDVEFHGRGTVECSETRSTKDGERHSATLRLSKGAMEHEAPKGGDEERSEIRGDLEKSYAGAQKQDAALADK